MAGGDQWEQVHEDLNAASFNAVASNTAGFLIVGNDHDDQAIAWESSDGRQWNRATSSDFDGYTIDGVGALDSGYAIFGRDTAANSILVWTSIDLERWEIAVVDTTLPADSQIRAIATSGGVHVAVGIDTTEGTAVIWISRDGQTWDLSPLP